MYACLDFSVGSIPYRTSLQRPPLAIDEIASANVTARDLPFEVFVEAVNCDSLVLFALPAVGINASEQMRVDLTPSPLAREDVRICTNIVREMDPLNTILKDSAKSIFV